MVERLTVEVYTRNQLVAGSIPAAGTCIFFCARGGHAPCFALRHRRGPTERTGTQNGICDFRGDLVFCTQACRLPWAGGLGAGGLRLGECGARTQGTKPGDLNQGTKEPRNRPETGCMAARRETAKQQRSAIPLKPHARGLLKRERNYDEDCAARASRCRPASRKNARSSPVSVKVRRGAGARATAAGASPVSVKVRRATGGRATAAGAAPDRPLPSLRTPPLAVFFFTAKPPSQIERCARRGGGFRALSSWARERGVRSASSRFSRARSQSGVQSSLRATRPVRRHHRADRGRRSLAAPRTPRRRRCGRGRCRGTPASIAQRRD